MRLQLVFLQRAKSYMSVNYFCLPALIGHKVKTENLWLCLGGYSMILQKHLCIPGHRSLLGSAVGHVCPIGDIYIIQSPGTNVP